MCTLSWWRAGTSFGVFFNRDEARKRLEAKPVSHYQENGVRYLSPIDTDGGGTWIWANENGVICCLLNNYRDQKNDPVNPVSRGLLLKSFGDQSDISSLFKALSSTNIVNFKGFYMFGMDKNGHRLASWNGEQLQLHHLSTVRSPISSSGHLPEEIPRYRRDLYKKRLGDNPSPRELYSFHKRHDSSMPAHSVMMRRPDARTVSVSQVCIDPHKVLFSYGSVSEHCRVRELKTKTIYRAD